MAFAMYVHSPLSRGWNALRVTSVQRCAASRSTSGQHSACICLTPPQQEIETALAVAQLSSQGIGNLSWSRTT
jgi:hypothetical protein